jgi:hypothetical protein
MENCAISFGNIKIIMIYLKDLWKNKNWDNILKNFVKKIRNLFLFQLMINLNKI